jgi:hypothetical protein
MADKTAETVVIYPYSQSSCLKCGAWENTTEYRPAGHIRESLLRVCKCGFRWITETKDAGARAP